MSMIGNYFMTDEETVQKIQCGELLVEDLIYGENDDAEEEHVLDIDKSWQAIHFMLTGECDESTSDDILSKVVLSGNIVNDEDVGYGPAMLISVSEVTAIANIIDGVSQEAFRIKFNFADMQANDIYPITDNDNEEEFFGYVWAYFFEMQKFFRKAAMHNKCILFYIN